MARTHTSDVYASLQNYFKRKKKKKPTMEEDFEKFQSQQDILAEKQKQKSLAAREEGRKYAEEVLSRNYPGISAEDKLAMEETAKSQINRDLQKYNRQLLAQQGRKGITGGAAQTQQSDLSRYGLEAQGQFQRDLAKLDYDYKMKKLASAIALEQGAVSEDILRNQTASEMIKAYNEQNYQKYLADQANKLFQRI